VRKIVVVAALSLALSACGGSPRHAPEAADPLAVTPVPAVADHESACGLLVGDPDRLKELVTAVSAGRSAAEDKDVAALQEQLFAISAGNPGALGSLVGQMVDYLDDPGVWSAAGKPKAEVLATIAKVRRSCGNP